jgi:hypothetical protein
MPDLWYSKQSAAEGTSLLGPYAVINSFETLIYYTPVNAFNLGALPAFGVFVVFLSPAHEYIAWSIKSGHVHFCPHPLQSLNN